MASVWETMGEAKEQHKHKLTLKDSTVIVITCHLDEICDCIELETVWAQYTVTQDMYLYKIYVRRVSIPLSTPNKDDDVLVERDHLLDVTSCQATSKCSVTTIMSANNDGISNLCHVTQTFDISISSGLSPLPDDFVYK